MTRFAVEHFVVERFTVAVVEIVRVVRMVGRVIRVEREDPLSLAIARQLPQQFYLTLGAHLHFPQVASAVRSAVLFSMLSKV